MSFPKLIYATLPRIKQLMTQIIAFVQELMDLNVNGQSIHTTYFRTYAKPINLGNLSLE
jgi:hypothetical protein